MRVSVFNTFPIAFCLVALGVDSLREILFIQQPTESPDPSFSYGINYTCISENDSSVLVLNKFYYDIRNKELFCEIDLPAVESDQPGHTLGKICALFEGNGCVTFWTTLNHWEIVNSDYNLLGSVSDSWWEGNCNRHLIMAEMKEAYFASDCMQAKYCTVSICLSGDIKNYGKTFFTSSHVKFEMTIRTLGSVMLSVRGSGKITIELRTPEALLKLQIKINTNGSNILECCEFAVSNNQKLFGKKFQISLAGGSLIDKNGWKTLVFTWKRYNTIWVCDKSGCFFEIPYSWVSLEEVHTTIHMEPPGIIRRHYYNYLWVGTENADLVSNRFRPSYQSLCIELIVRLCYWCALEIWVSDMTGQFQWIETIIQNTPYHESNYWQLVKLNKTLPESFNDSLQLKIRPILHNDMHPGQWSIYKFRTCEPVDAQRILTLTSNRQPIPSLQYEPGYTCQIMFATGNNTATSHPSFGSNKISKSTEEYLHENSYTQVRCSPTSRNGIIICDPYGCVCVQKTNGNDVVKVSSIRPPTYLECPKLNDSNVEIIPQRNGVVRLHLTFPKNFLKTCNISVQYERTWLRNQPSEKWNFSLLNECSKFPLEYNHTLNLLPSTEYLFRVDARHIHNQNLSYSKKFETLTSLGFKKDEKLEVNITDTFFQLKLPTILNDTLNSSVIVIVKGRRSSKCRSKNLWEELMKHTNMTKPEEGWIAEDFSTQESRPTVIIKISKYPAASNMSEYCLLHPGENYTILVVLIDWRTNTSAFIESLPKNISSTSVITAKQKNDESISGWLISLFILAVCSILLFIWRRKVIIHVKRIRQDIILYSQTLKNLVKSTTTITVEQPAVSFEVFSDPLFSAIVNTSEEAVPDDSATCIRIADFEKYVKESIDIGILKSQFKMFPKGILKPCAHGSLQRNKIKNRYPNIIPYDDTRVVLKQILGDSCSDYINANYVQGFRKERAYIATQGPKSETVDDFWRMIWQEKTLVICMLANVFESRKAKCTKYWPEFGHSRTYGDIVVVTESHHAFADYMLRTFRVSRGQKTRKIEHMHYTGWADHTVPLYTHSMIAYLRKFLMIEIGPGPVVVHCSAGVGRTGTFILCDICLRRAAATGKIDVLAELKKLRDSRLNMVDTELQYKFVHVILAECLLSLPTQLPCDNALPRAIEVLKKQLPQHIQRLNDTAWQDQILCSSSVTPRPPIPENMKKNRFPELAPLSNSLVYLKRYPTNDVNSDYINAVSVDGLKTKKQYLTSQLPLPSTLSDFWRLVAEQEVQHIIVLQRPDPYDYTCCDIIDDKSPFNPVPFINVEVKTSTDTGESFIIDEFLLTDKSEGLVPKTRQISVLMCREWGLGKNGKPPPPMNLVKFWIASQNICREEGPTLVLCHDGVTGCGLYLALSFLLERMAVERECDIILAVRAIRRSRFDFVQSQEQFEYLYDAAAKYIETFETYANFA